jgi:Amidohydrolase family
VRLLQRPLGRVLAASFLAVFGSQRLLAFQDEGGGEGGGEEAAVVDEDEAEPSGDHHLAVVGGDVYDGDGTVLRGATVLAKNRKIVKIGYDLDIPDGATVLHVEGLRVYPGLVAISSQGLVGTSNDFEDSVDPFDPRMVLGLASGITSTGVGSSAVKLKRFEIGGVLIADKTYISLKWDSRDPAGKRSLQEKFEKASDYLRKYRSWEERVKKDKELKEPSRRGVDSTVLSILRGETMARFRADDRTDLLGIARLAQTFGFRPVIEGCREGWTVADELGRAGAMAIVTPRERRAKDEHLVREGGSSIENAAILYRSGVQVAVIPARQSVDLGGIVGRDIMHLPIEADFAVRGGLPEQAALDAITIVPARMMGISHRVGSLEVGKDCDLIVTDGDILHYRTFVQYAVVDGKLVYDKEKELWFAQIRPRPPQKPEPDAGEAPEEEHQATEPSGDEDHGGDDGPDKDEEEGG